MKVWHLVVILFIGFIVFSASTSYLIIKLGNVVVENGGIKKMVQPIWEGK
jgi:hypothetical protein